jgi:prophage regulatory protein
MLLTRTEENMTDSAPIALALDDALLDWPQLEQLVPLSRSTVWALRRAGKFPQPVQISNSRVAWRRSEILAWMAARPAAAA